jgi:hypothetical protein
MTVKLIAIIIVIGFLLGATKLKTPSLDFNAEEHAQLEAGVLKPDVDKLEGLRKANPRRAEFIQSLIDFRTQYRSSLSELQSEFASTTDKARAKELQQAIHDLKLQTELGIIEAQIALAVFDGRDEDARKMDLILQESKKFLITPGE